MKDSTFIDTNILVYLYSDDEAGKKLISKNLLNENSSFISTQVLLEFSNTMRKKYKAEWDKISRAIDEITGCVSVFTNHIETIKHAIAIAEKYRYSFYDSLIIAAALEANCKILYSEDMQHNQVIDKQLRIVNPFRK